MVNTEALKARVEAPGNRRWDQNGIEERLKAFTDGGIPEKKLDEKAIVASKDTILERVQLRGEEYE